MPSRQPFSPPSILTPNSSRPPGTGAPGSTTTTTSTWSASLKNLRKKAGAELQAKTDDLIAALKPGKGRTILRQGKIGRVVRGTCGLSIYFPGDRINTAYRLAAAGRAFRVLWSPAPRGCRKRKSPCVRGGMGFKSQETGMRLHHEKHDLFNSICFFDLRTMNGRPGSGTSAALTTRRPTWRNIERANAVTFINCGLPGPRSLR